MAVAQAALTQEAERPKERPIHSRPVFKQVITMNSLQAQRVMERSFVPVSRSLFSIEVILRIIGEQEEIDAVESVIHGHFERVATDLDQAASQLKKLMEDNGIEAVPAYTNPNEYEIEIISPQLAQFARLIQKLDLLMGLIDTLWLNAILSNKQRTDATYQWQQRLIKLAGRIIGLEKRARIAAHSKGKQTEVDEAAPAVDAEDPELAAEAAAEAEPATTAVPA